MQMLGEQHIAAPVQRVWEALNDPDILRASIPGCQSLDKSSAERFDAVVEVKVGPIGARFKGAVTLTDLNPPNSYTLLLEGNGGIAGTAKGAAKVKLSAVDGGTLVSYDVDAQVGGRMAQLGGPIIDATAKQLAGKFFSGFGEIVSGKKAAAPAPAAAAAKATQPALGAPAPAGGFPIAWILAIAVAMLCGFIFGSGSNLAESASAWTGLSIGLLLILVAATAFEYGRRTAAPIVTLDSALLRRLLEGDKQ
ncbi:CoxG family protein [Zhongshania sp.]|uniref:CoxG family protein n=1 Tax=Zhongshania sp. TaxID=1971902 RepID=UPI0035696000